VAETVLDIISEPPVLAGVKRRHELFMQGLHAINRRFGVFTEIRGRGLLLGCALKSAWQGRAKDVVDAALARGLLALVAGPDVIRLAPALIIAEELIEAGLQRFSLAIADLVK
jgi:acetylornithine/succinyldiaminopimelate/putrescine aminotransferase